MEPVGNESMIKNPRNQRSFPFENVRFLLEEYIMNKETGGSSSTELFQLNEDVYSNDRTMPKLMDRLLLLHLSSDAFTGLLTEIKGLVNIGILELSITGKPTLNSGWATKIPQNILNDMYESGWHPLMDPENKFCLHENIRKNLPTTWSRHEAGWTMDGTKIIYNHDLYYGNRRNFEEKYEDFINDVDGIGKFGF